MARLLVFESLVWAGDGGKERSESLEESSAHSSEEKEILFSKGENRARTGGMLTVHERRMIVHRYILQKLDVLQRIVVLDIARVRVTGLNLGLTEPEDRLALHLEAFPRAFSVLLLLCVLVRLLLLQLLNRKSVKLFQPLLELGLLIGRFSPAQALQLVFS